ncbi:MAG: hypothetical protein K2W84_11670 [Burkholderiales bacterium]|nr:hypothetical protein [Burkholderiales bacterium]
MDAQTYVMLIGAISRALSLAIAGLGGICCIVLGWLLYRDGVRIATQGLLEHKEIKLKLSTSGPGVFLVAFGAAILIYLITTKASFEAPPADCPAKQSRFQKQLERKSQGPSRTADPASNLAQPGFMTVAATKEQPPSARNTSCRPCRVWAASFLEGNNPAPQYRAALDRSIELLADARQAAQARGGDNEVAAFRDHIDRLRELRNNLNEK